MGCSYLRGERRVRRKTLLNASAYGLLTGSWFDVIGGATLPPAVTGRSDGRRVRSTCVAMLQCLPAPTAARRGLDAGPGTGEAALKPRVGTARYRRASAKLKAFSFPFVGGGRDGGSLRPSE